MTDARLPNYNQDGANDLVSQLARGAQLRKRPNDYADLIARLRRIGGSHTEPTQEAADAIEALVRERDELTRAVRLYCKIEGCDDWKCDGWEALARHIEEHRLPRCASGTSGGPPRRQPPPQPSAWSSSSPT